MENKQEIKSKIAVFGLGHVGLVTAACYAEKGHQIVGIELSRTKIKFLQEKKLYIKEKSLDKLFVNNFDQFTFSSDYNKAMQANIIIVAVGTPATQTGKVDLSQLLSVINDIANIIKFSSDKKTIVIRSTIPPQTMSNHILPNLERLSNKKESQDFDLLFYPEFLREGSAIADFHSPSLTVIGSNTGQKQSITFLDEAELEQTHFVKYEEAEMLKYMNNSFHALKVAYANELSSIASSLDVDTSKVFELFLADKKLNISEKYLKPGFSFGGTCLTKDTMALSSFAKQANLETPIINSILQSNNSHTIRFLDLIDSKKWKKAIFLGVTFKKDTNDTRASEILKLINFLLERPTYHKKNLTIFDSPQVTTSLNIPNVKLISDEKDAESDYDLIVIGPQTSENIISNNPQARIVNLNIK